MQTIIKNLYNLLKMSAINQKFPGVNWKIYATSIKDNKPKYKKI